jgi:hypothetical protein
VPTQCLHVCEQARRARWSDLREYGGVHVTSIDPAPTPGYPWRE